jgi:branched-chain amino acid transport system permease protein
MKYSLIVFVILALAPLVITDEYLLYLMVISLYFGTQAMAFDFTAGFTGMINFGFAAFLGLGAYVSAIVAVRLGISPWFGIWLGAAVASALGWFLGLLTLRLRGIFATVMSWFVGLTLLSLAAALVPLTRGYLGLNVPLFLDTAERRPYYYLLLSMTVLTYLILHNCIRSRLGLAFRAIGENVELARASGIDPNRYGSLNLMISCAIAGLLGGFYAHFVGILTPDIMQTSHTVEVLALTYIGGRSTLWGGLLASFLIIPLFEYLKPLFAIRLVIYGLLLIVMTIFCPGGIASLLPRAVIKAERAKNRG